MNQSTATTWWHLEHLTKAMGIPFSISGSSYVPALQQRVPNTDQYNDFRYDIMYTLYSLFPSCKLRCG